MVPVLGLGGSRSHSSCCFCNASQGWEPVARGRDQVGEGRVGPGPQSQDPNESYSTSEPTTKWGSAVVFSLGAADLGE